jgi:hypothetical protein
MMRDIYRRCSSCIIWLGELDEHVDSFSPQDAVAAFDFLKGVAAAESIGPQALPLPTLLKNTPEGERVRKAFAAFAMYGNTWWSRIWTIQEAVIPKSAVYVWGHLSISRDDVFRASRYLRISNTRKHFSRDFTKQRIRFYELLRRLLYPINGFIHSTTDDGPLDLLMRWRHRDATDPRDKVYALMGLVPGNVLPSARTYDYTMAPAILFARVTFDLIQEEMGLRPLIGSCDMPHKTPGVPSWAIDFANCNRIGLRQMKWWNHSHRYKVFSACGTHALHASLHQDRMALLLKGVFVDDVDQVADSIYQVPDDVPIATSALYDYANRCVALLTAWRNQHGDPDSYVAGGTWDSALARTSIGDLTMGELPIDRARPVHETYFDDLRSAPEGKARGPVIESFKTMVPNHAFFVTKNGYIGMGPLDTRPGDQVWVLYGGKVPFLVREVRGGRLVGESREFTLVGDAYVHGVMDGQALRDGEGVESICLV